MSFLDGLNKALDKTVQKTIDKSSEKIVSKIEKMLIEDEKIELNLGVELGYVVFTNKRMLLGNNFESTTKPNKTVTYIPYSKINSVQYEYEKTITTNNYKVNVKTSSTEHIVHLLTEDEAILIHKKISSFLL